MGCVKGKAYFYFLEVKVLIGTERCTYHTHTIANSGKKHYPGFEDSKVKQVYEYGYSVR